MPGRARMWSPARWQLGVIAETIPQHHERLDGSGYPAGLRSEGILPEARVPAVADVCEAKLSHRPHSACARLFRDQSFAFVG